MIDLTDIKPNSEKAIFLAKKQLPELVCDAVNLEGINFTLPEVQTLLDGVTVGGHKLSDERITLNQAEAWKLLFKWLESNQFELTKSIACQLHAVAGREEALVWGKFRSGKITIAGTEYLPPDAEKLDHCWEQMLEQANAIQDIFDKAIYIFLQMARNQFFYDVNKRMGRFMMNGLLLQSGMPAINLLAKRQEEFNRLMLDFYVSNNVEPMTQFMKSCLSPQIIAIMSE